MTHWWSEKWGKDNICPITQTRLRQGVNKKGIKYTTELYCGHRFCTQPLLKWLGAKSTCPVCRHPFSLKEIIECNYLYK